MEREVPDNITYINQSVGRVSYLPRIIDPWEEAFKSYWQSTWNAAKRSNPDSRERLRSVEAIKAAQLIVFELEDSTQPSV